MDTTTILSAMSRPFWWSTEAVATFNAPGNSYATLTSKIFRVCAAILLSPISLVLKAAAELCLLFKAEPYVYKKGEAHSSSVAHELTILSWNICGLPGGLPAWFGGVSPILKRVDKIATFIFEEDCDIVCLQEMHDTAATQALFEKLRHRYKHFYLNIGSKAFQHNSGLFVASKKQLTKTSFKSFDYAGKQFGINKGAFTFELTDEKGDPLRIVTTHLQPYTKKKDQGIRAQALKDIFTKSPKIVCGDLNIDRFKPEKGSELIESKMVDNLEAVETATDRLMPGKSEQDNFSIDYCLLKKGIYTIHTELRKAYDLSNPKEALSDHHALRSSIRRG